MSFNGHIDGAAWTNVMWLLTTGYDSATGTDVSDLATDLFGVFQTNLLPWTSTNNHLTSVQCVLYQTSGELMGSSTADHTGGASGAYLNGAAAAILSWGTTAFWRGGKPRTYLAGLSQSALGTSTTLSSSYVASLASAAADFLGDVNGLAPGALDTVTLGFLSRVSGGAPRTPPVFYPYFTVFVRSNFGSQRGRNEYTGI